MPPYSWTDPAVLPFTLIPVLLVAVFARGVHIAWQRAGEPPAVARRAAVWAVVGAAAWMTITWAAAAAGLLRAWDRMPPRFAFLVASILALSAALAFSRIGRRLAALPLWALVAVQSFRLPLELAMHAMFERGIMPGVMSYSGRNFDIVTGITAIAVAAALASGLGGRRLAAAWNAVGLLLLVNVVVVAILATPVFRYFGDGQINVWITYPPFIWLPSVMVLAALAGHLVIARALWTHAGHTGAAR